ncbi:MAG: hypothetical protein EBZ24_15165 [Synechococcaceae bacterium WB9_4xB_025]|nr:hypothetical protein [Synechococcaceae bacterium WB9_4xB_025]
MPETSSTAADLSASDDLISFLKAIPDGRYRRGVRYPQWFLLLVAVLGILSGCRSSQRSGGLCQAAPGGAEPGPGPEL